jgi:hypothetical protein
MELFITTAVRTSNPTKFIYFENHTNLLNMLSGKEAEFMNVEAGDAHSTHFSLKVEPWLPIENL